MPPENGPPDAWRMVLDRLDRIDSNMVTKAEFALYQQHFDGAIADMHRRIDEVTTRTSRQVAEIETDVDRMRDEAKQEQQDRQKQQSERRFTLAMAIFAGVISVVSGIAVFVIQQGVMGG